MPKHKTDPTGPAIASRGSKARKRMISVSVRTPAWDATVFHEEVNLRVSIATAKTGQDFASRTIAEALLLKAEDAVATGPLIGS